MTPTAPISPRHKSHARLRSVVALTVSYERDSLLRRGLGLEHLNELVRRLARLVVLSGRSLAYAGNWQQREDNFTNVLRSLINSEQDDILPGDGETATPDGSPQPPRHIAPLINHLAWPHYLELPTRSEAEAINSCRVLRITQADAKLTESCPDSEASFGSDLAVLNAAVTLSAMRRLQVEGMHVQAVREQPVELIPGLAARICLGGREAGMSGFIPGVFEEALRMLEQGRPLLLLGGFGGATASLAQAFLDPASAEKTFDPVRLEKLTPALGRLNEIAERLGMPAEIASTKGLCDALLGLVKEGGGLKDRFKTGLLEEDTRLLMTTTDIDLAVRLVRRSLDGLPVSGT